MGAFTQTKWIDLGDFGQHNAIITGKTGELPYIDSMIVEVKGETIQLVHLLPRTLEVEILAEVEIDEREYFREQAEDRKLDAAMEPK